MDPKLKIDENGTKRWWLYGKLHRVDGPALIYPDGTESWYLNGKLHRVDGPAVTEPSKFQAWCLNDECHRLDGPAIIYPDGSVCYYAFDVEYNSLEELIIGVIMDQ